MFVHIMKVFLESIPFFRLFCLIESFPSEQPFYKMMSCTYVQGSWEFMLDELTHTIILFRKSNVEFVE